jgi:Holliday junction resolvase RusA-like endonuclease
LYDALNGLLWRDDSLICDGRVQKVYAAGDEQPHVEIAISEATL